MGLWHKFYMNIESAMDYIYVILVTKVNAQGSSPSAFTDFLHFYEI